MFTDVGRQIRKVVFISVLHLENLFCWRERGEERLVEGDEICKW